MKTFREQFIDYAENKRHKDTRYEYMDPHNCACAQFAKFMGVTYDANNVHHESDKFHDYEPIAAEAPHTWGALAKRLRAL